MRLSDLATQKMIEMELEEPSFVIERAMIEELLPREYARTVSVPRWTNSSHEIYFWRSHLWPNASTARIAIGELWVDSIGIVHPESPPHASNVVTKVGWVLSIDERAVTGVGEFAAVVEKLQDRRLGLPQE